MAEPVATPICTAALIMSGLTCTLFGLDFESLFWGFAGGLIAQTFIPDASKHIEPPAAFSFAAMLHFVFDLIKSAAPIVAGAVLAAALTPVGINIITNLGLAAGIGSQALKIVAALVLGIIAPTIPAMLRKRSEGGGS